MVPDPLRRGKVSALQTYPARQGQQAGSIHLESRVHGRRHRLAGCQRRRDREQQVLGERQASILRSSAKKQSMVKQR